LNALDQLTQGAFSAATSGDRSACLRQWLNTEPDMALVQEVFVQMSHKDKGAAKLLKERIDEHKRQGQQDVLAHDWAERAQALLSGARLNIADAMAWQRDAAKAGAPLSREPLAALRVALAEKVRLIEELQHQVMVEREAAVLLAQRVEVLSTKPVAEAQAATVQLAQDVAQWQSQTQALQAQPDWASVDMKLPVQLQAAQEQLQAVWSGFEQALAQAVHALSNQDAALPEVPVWADEVRRSRGEVVEVTAPAAVTKPARTSVDPQQRQQQRAQATAAVEQVLLTVEQHLQAGQGKDHPETVAALRAVLKEHGQAMDHALDARVHEALTSAGDSEGWQRWLADQLRQALVQRAEALMVDAPEPPVAPETKDGADSEPAAMDAGEPAPAVAPTPQQPTARVPALTGRKMQEAIRQLRQEWKTADQGGYPNHGLWRRFDAACNAAYATVEGWLGQRKQEAGEQRKRRAELMQELQTWTQQEGQGDDWRAHIRALHDFSERWRHAGHMSEKAFAQLQQQWKDAYKLAGARLHAAQKQSLTTRHQFIDQAKALAEVTPLNIDAVKQLQQAWQVEAQKVPLDRRTEQKLWESFRAPIDQAFQRKGPPRERAPHVALSARDQAVLDAAKALEQANAGGDAAVIRQAMQALEAALQAQRLQQPATPSTAAAPVQAPEASEPTSSDAPAAQEAQAPAAPKVPKAVVAVRGDDRPGALRPGTPAPKDQGRKPFGGRESRDGREPRRDDMRGRRDDGPRSPRLADAAFHAQRQAMEHAQAALRKLQAQAHGEVLSQLLGSWQARDAEALPAAQALGRSVNATVRQSWRQALEQAPAAGAGDTAMLRLEMAAQVPTPADKLEARRALQLQLLTRRNDPSPVQTWAQDVAQVLREPHDAGQARRLQAVLKVLLKG
jgi:hypothetical protein